MQAEDKPRFAQKLADVLAGYGKPLPDKALVEQWFRMLAPFSPASIGLAFSAYAAERPDHAPTPNSIAARCQLADGRPGAEEAWAVALTSRDESDTVVWTAECAEAFALCQPVLAIGDEIGARMAFKEAYNRIVAKARAEHRPVQWSASLGWDQTKRIAALSHADRAGLLPAPTVAALLPAPGRGAPDGDEKARAQLAAIRKMLADSAAAKEREIEEAAERQRMADDQWKRETSERVDAYQRGNP